MKRLPKSELGRGSNNQLLVMNGRVGRVTLTVTRKAKDGWRVRFHWFPPRDDTKTARVQNRECCPGVGRDVLAIYAVDQAAAFDFAYCIARTRGPYEVERMRKWIKDREDRGMKFARVDIATLANARARFVHVASVG